jgi:hypothetical protein
MNTDIPNGIRRITIYAGKYEPAKLDIVNKVSELEVVTLRRGEGMALVYEWEFRGRVLS